MRKHRLRNESTNGKKIFEVVEKLKLKDFNIYLRTDELTTRQGIINLSDDYTNGTHFVAFIDHYYFDSFCVEPPRSISNQLLKRNPENFCETYISSTPIQNPSDSNCASYCLYFLYLMSKGFGFEKTIMTIVNDR